MRWAHAADLRMVGGPKLHGMHKVKVSYPGHGLLHGWYGLHPLLKWLRPASCNGGRGPHHRTGGLR